MPGDESKIGDYTIAELNAMPTDQLEAAKAAGFRKSVAAFPVPDLNARPDAEIRLGSSVPAATRGALGAGWAKKRTSTEEFVCPSGERCRLRPLSPERLLEVGILDRVTRLEGLADQLVQQAEGAPPTKSKMPTREEFADLLDTINLLVPIAVAEPEVVSDSVPDDELRDGQIKISWIDLGDRIAIMTKALDSLTALDRFR